MTVISRPTSNENQSKSVQDNPRLSFTRKWTDANRSVYDEVVWEKRDAVIKDVHGKIVFEARNIEVPSAWSQLTTNVVVSKYFQRSSVSGKNESSIKTLIDRVVNTITDWGILDRYFSSPDDALSFKDELKYLLLHQMGSFNSPVWFNLGIEDEPQCSACFINSIHDNLDSILDLVKTEGRLFRFGSGSGINISPLRGSKEPIRGGGTASGPLSFMRGFDAFAGAIKSGGKTRRAAKMVMLDIDHPDIEDFIRSKTIEEEKARALIIHGYDGSFGGEAYSSVFFQNANHSIRVTDEFMDRVESDGDWQTINRSNSGVAGSYKAAYLMNTIANEAWRTGDPGIQFHSTINKWNTCSYSGPITGSNPCSEFMFLEDSACNLASLNLMRFRTDDGGFDVESFNHAVSILITAQDIVIDHAGYPSPKNRENSVNFRPLGLGYANLGALLMSKGFPYDSNTGRAYAGTITALLGGSAYYQSAKLARAKGHFNNYIINNTSMSAVMDKHHAKVDEIDSNLVSTDLLNSARAAWDNAVKTGQKWGYRNAQVTVLAPTGTIGFMMDCDTTGVEPDLALVKYKQLVGGGVLKLTNRTVPLALKALGYSTSTIETISDYILENDSIEGCPVLKAEHLKVFDCALKPSNGDRYIEPEGHILMMAAVQPFLSGAISKTVNLPSHCTPSEISKIYMKAWELGLKSIAIYRDGCKLTQPLNTSKKQDSVLEQTFSPARRRLENERAAITHKFSIGGHEGYITVGLYNDGKPGEIFITMSKEGSTISGLMDAFATAISLALQYGVPLNAIANKLSHTRYEPSGFTGNPELPLAKSITDYIFRWLTLKFTKETPIAIASSGNEVSAKVTDMKLKDQEEMVFASQADAPSCVDCGSITARSGTCYNCLNCGATSGCS